MKRVNLFEGSGEGELMDEPSSRRGLIILVVVAVMVLGGLAAGYFGYYLPRVKEGRRITRLEAEREVQQELRREEEPRGRAEEEERAKKALGEEAKLLPSTREEAPGPKLFEPIRPEEKVRAESAPAPRVGERLVSKEVKPEPLAKPVEEPAAMPPPPPPEIKAPEGEVEKKPPPPKPEVKAEKKLPPTKRPAPSPPRTVAAVPKKPRPPAKPYTVRVASCLFDECVRVTQARLKARGYGSHVGGVRTRLIRYEVRLASPLPRGPSQNLKDELKAAGIMLKERNVKGNLIQLVGGPYVGLEDAYLTMDRLEKRGVKGRVVSLPEKATMKEVRVGHFESKASAQRMRARLVRGGFEADVVRR